MRGEIWSAGVLAGILARVSFDKLRMTLLGQRNGVTLSLSKGDATH